MCKIEKILVPVDFSKCSWAATKYAAIWARRFGAELTLLHVWRVPWYLDDTARVTTSTGSHQTLSAHARSSAQAEMTRFLLGLEDERDITVRARVAAGTPRNVILKVADACIHDLIIMGTNGRTGLAHLFLGSTAEGVVRRAPCPVLTVGEAWHRSGASPRPLTTAPTRGQDQGRVQRILVPVDVRDCSVQALEYALTLGEKLGASIDVLHAVAPPHSSAPLMPSQDGRPRLDLSEGAVRHAQGKLTEILRPLVGRHAAVSPRVAVGPPRDEILAAVDTQQYDLIIMGTHGRMGFSHLLLGSTAEQVVRRAACPVLTIRSPHHGE